jgi:NAD(P)H-dependent FMN reductase
VDALPNLQEHVMSVRVLALVGSLRAGSHNRQLAEAAVKHAPEGVEVVIFDGLADVPFYNEDLDVEGSVPAAATALREAAGQADAFLFFSPEYNGTITAVLKNAVDWLSRPFGAGALSGKPTAVVGTAYGQFGGLWAQDETRKTLGIAGANVLVDAKLSIPGSVVRFAELHPQDDAEVVEQLPAVVALLAEATAVSA